MNEPRHIRNVRIPAAAGMAPTCRTHAGLATRRPMGWWRIIAAILKKIPRP